MSPTYKLGTIFKTRYNLKMGVPDNKSILDSDLKNYQYTERTITSEDLLLLLDYKPNDRDRNFISLRFLHVVDNVIIEASFSIANFNNWFVVVKEL